jgi:hypothetical protein
VPPPSHTPTTTSLYLSTSLSFPEARAELLRGPHAADARVTTHVADVVDDAGIRGALEAAADAHGGRLDGLICSAGISCPREFELTPTDEFERVFRVNVLGTRNAVAAALPFLRAGGRIVLVSSQAGQVGL